MKLLVYLVFLLIIVNLSFAACKAGFTDNLTIRTLDKSLRPVEGANVTITYQLDETTAKGYYTAPVKTTNENGIVNYTNIKNLETFDSKVDCDIGINLTFDKKKIAKKVEALAHQQVIDFVLDAYRIFIKVIDEKGKPIDNALVWINERKKTSKNGTVELAALAGETRVYAKYLDGKTEQVIEVINDTTLTLQFTFYDLMISVRDDKDIPLQSTIKVGDSTYQTNDEGELSLTKLVGPYKNVRIIYESKEKVLDIDLTSHNRYLVVFDNSKPTIKNVNVIEEPDKIKVVITAVDEGEGPSGIADNGVSVHYVTETGATKKATVYQSKKGEYTSEIPIKPTMTEVVFTVEVKDNEKNRVIAEGKHVLPQPENLDNKTSGQNGGNLPNTPNTGDIPMHFIIGGILILMIVIYVVYRYVFKKKGEGE